jgi:hypothetical protein
VAKSGRRTVVRETEEVDGVLNDAAELVDDGESRFSGKTYEEGVLAGIRWLLGDDDTNPMAD